jgi:dolichol-phosphate mannosyltransferase
MNSNEIELSIIIPSYLEEENLRIILPRIKSELSSLPFTFEVLVIDTIQNLDNTEKVCAENNISHINREIDNFYGDAVRTGIKHASGKYTIFMDADGSHPPEFIHKLLEYKGNFDVVIASRYIEGGSTDNFKMLILMSLIVNILYSKVLGIKCKDVSNSYKLYLTSDLKDLHLKCANFDIVEEILYKLTKSKNDPRIKEVPFGFKKRMFGQTKRNLFLFTISYMITIVRLRFDI